MITRCFGRTGHESTIAVFGACALGFYSQERADVAMQQVIDAGVTHIDIAPSYGNAEERISPWMPRIRDDFFLGCKTMERTAEGARREMQESLSRLQTDHFDLYQIHAITSQDELNQATKSGGALDAMIAAREKGLTKYIGITGHGIDAPKLFLEALRRFDFDSVLFPLNFVLYGIPKYRQAAEELIEVCQHKDVGMMGIKHITRGPWGDKTKTYNTWYEPFTEDEMIQQAVDFALSQGITGICTPCDVDLLPRVLQACQQFNPMSKEEQEKLIQQGKRYSSLF